MEPYTNIQNGNHGPGTQNNNTSGLQNIIYGEVCFVQNNIYYREVYLENVNPEDRDRKSLAFTVGHIYLIYIRSAQNGLWDFVTDIGGCLPKTRRDIQTAPSFPVSTLQQPKWNPITTPGIAVTSEDPTVLRVQVVRCSNLPVTDFFGLSDP